MMMLEHLSTEWSFLSKDHRCSFYSSSCLFYVADIVRCHLRLSLVVVVVLCACVCVSCLVRALLSLSVIINALTIQKKKIYTSGHIIHRISWDAFTAPILNVVIHFFFSVFFVFYFFNAMLMHIRLGCKHCLIVAQGKVEWQSIGQTP
jgi:hypothetical protein